MSREALSYVSLLLCAAIILNAECTSGIRDGCLELISFDIDEIEDHLSELNLTDVPTVKMMTAGFKCPVSTLPFGALKSDWARLLLLREAQPDGSIVKLKLVRLIRLLIVAYYQMEERIVTGAEAKSAKAPPVRGTTTAVPVAGTSQPHRPTSGNSSVAETSRNDAKSRPRTDYSFSNDGTRLATKDNCSRIETRATVIENATTKSPSSPSGAGTTTVVPSDAARQNVTSPIDPAATAYYSGNAKKAALRVLGDCLKYPSKGKSSRKVFEIVRNGTKYAGRAARRTDERDRSPVKISPPTNEFWRYVPTFPTGAPLTVGGVAPTYRVRGLSGFGTGSPRKSRKRTKLNNDIYESLRRFYDVGKK